MNAPTNPCWHARVVFAGIAGALALGAIAALPSPAHARVWVSAPCCGWYGPGPYYGYYPPPYYYGPPGAYYAPPYPPAAPGPAPSAYSPQSAYPAAAPTAPGPSAYSPQSAYPGPGAPATPDAAAAITYTSKPAFTNAAGQTCREYKTNAATGQPVYGTACREADGQWRVAN